MGGVVGTRKTKPGPNARLLRRRIRSLEAEMAAARCKREEESRACEREAAALAKREAEWRRERRLWKEEVGRLKQRLEEKEERIWGLEAEVAAMQGKGREEEELQSLDTDLLMEHLIEEQALREEAVAKWKRLYLAIKTELDALILRTCQGERVWGGGEGEEVQRLQREVRAKEEMVASLMDKLAASERDGARRQREADILRQSLRIMSSAKRPRSGKCLSRRLRF